MRWGWLLACCLAVSTGSAIAQESEDFGPPLTQAQFRATAEEGIRAQLKDPDSARFKWPYVAVPMSYKPAFEARRSGYLTCGLVNAKNSYGGYGGDQIVMVMVYGSEVIYAEMRYQNSLANDCAKLRLNSSRAEEIMEQHRKRIAAESEDKK